MAIGELWKRLVGGGVGGGAVGGSAPAQTAAYQTPVAEFEAPAVNETQLDDSAFDLAKNLDQTPAAMPIAAPSPLSHSQFAYYTPHGVFDELVDTLKSQAR